jgi:hypothetical protein
MSRLSIKEGSSANTIKFQSKSSGTIAVSIFHSNLEFCEIRAQILSQLAQTGLKKPHFFQGRRGKKPAEDRKVGYLPAPDI